MSKRSHLFKVKRGQLYYDNKPIGNSEHNPGFSRLYFEEEPLSEDGANGVVFRASHNILDIQQVVKVWRPTTTNVFTRAKEEAKKNANRSLGHSVTHINDAGIYNYPCEIFFAVMEIVSDTKTLKDWIKLRNGLLRIVEEETKAQIRSRQKELEELIQKAKHHTKHPTKDIQKLKQDIKDKKDYLQKLTVNSCAQALNITAGLLLCTGTIYENGMTHGDLHEGNLLVIDDDENTQTDLRKFHNVGTPGTLIAADIRIIDIGTSKAIGTNREIGQQRDIDKMINNTQRVLSPLLKHLKASLADWIFPTAQRFSNSAPPLWIHKGEIVSAGTIAGDLLRLTIFLNLALGYATNAPNQKGSLTLEDNGPNDFNDIMLEEIPELLIELKSGNSLSSLRFYSTASSGNYINWSKVWQDLTKRYPALSSYCIFGDTLMASSLLTSEEETDTQPSRS